MSVSIGCGSWTDAVYTGVLYPRGTKAADRLAAYARMLDHVEVNSGFYATPKITQVKKWVEDTPPQFSFDFKLHKGLSQNPGKYQELVSGTLRQLEPLFEAGKFGTFLLMLSPYFEPERNKLKELDGLLASLKPHSVAVELRNRAWVEGRARQDTLKYYREKKIAWVSVDMPPVDQPGVMPPVDEVTVPKLAYLRLHGRNSEGYLTGKSAAEKHHYLYPAAELKQLVARIKNLEGGASQVRVVANNHAQDFAPRTALALKRLLGQKVEPIEAQGTFFGH